MFHQIAVIFALGCLVAACADTVDTFPLNDAAKQLGPIQISFVSAAMGRGPVMVKMADGEVLKGEYRVAFGASEAVAFSGAYSAPSIVTSNGHVQFAVTGPKTQMLCWGTNTPTGHGSGKCQTHDRAIWAVSW